ncbi:MAG: ABC transporter ATP-binding protein [Christensenellaceae bacterium]
MKNSESAPVLSLQNVCKSFGGVHAVRDVNTDISYGERRLFIGTNGAGKTTLFNLIAGDLAVSSGKIELFGTDITKLPVRRRVKMGIRRTYQTSALFDGLSIRQNMYLSLLGGKKDRSHFNMLTSISRDKESNDKIVKTAKEIGLYDKLDVQVESLSHGERRQLEFGLAILPEPKLLLLDEPAAGLSAEERAVMLSLIQGLSRDVTVVMIEHDIDLAFAIADYVVVMFDGAIVAQGTVDEIRKNELVQQIYLGEVKHE